MTSDPSQGSPVIVSRGRAVGRWVATFLVVACALITAPADAYERQWRLSGDVGYALAGFSEYNASGFGASVHVTYGLSDAFNLRFGTDLAAFDLPEPDTAAYLVGGSVGAEYVIDVLSWVPYVGVTVGAVDVIVQDEGHHPTLQVEVPLGIGYQLSRSVMLGFEARYRLLPLGGERIPSHNMLAFGTVAYTWGY